MGWAHVPFKVLCLWDYFPLLRCFSLLIRSSFFIISCLNLSLSCDHKCLIFPTVRLTVELTLIEVLMCFLLISSQSDF